MRALFLLYFPPILLAKKNDVIISMKMSAYYGGNPDFAKLSVLSRSCRRAAFSLGHIWTYSLEYGKYANCCSNGFLQPRLVEIRDGMSNVWKFDFVRIPEVELCIWKNRKNQKHNLKIVDRKEQVFWTMVVELPQQLFIFPWIHDVGFISLARDSKSPK